MKKGMILNLKKLKILDYVTLNKIFIILSLLFIVGIILGSTVLSDNAILLKSTDTFLNEYLSIHNSGVFLKKLFSCFLKYFFVLAIYFLSGASLLGVAIVPFITAWQGIIFGNTATHINQAYGLSGIAFNAIILIPTSAIFTVCCFFAAKCSVNFSLAIAKLTLPRSRPTNLFIEFKDYCLKFTIFLGISMICSILDIILNLLFLNFFEF